MSPTTTTPAGAKPAGKDESQSSTTRKPSSSRPQGPPVKCPRCDSPNTKFCYYNNYNLTQPRHFCKTCHRYWTKGGALRNVPIGGGCRKNKKIKPFPRLPSNSKDSTASSSSSAAAGLKFFQGLSPAMEFQLPKLHTPSNTSAAAAGSIFHHQFASNFSDLSNTSPAISQPPCFNLDPSLLEFAFPLPSSLKQGENLVFQEMVHHSNLATSIESLSSINQDLHWKLQQQRLATLFVEDGSQKEASGNIQKPQLIQFQSLENPKTDGSFSNTEWFLNNSYEPASSATAGNNVNGGAGNWSGGIQAWTEMSHYTSLP